MQAFGRLEADWGICAISLNALVAALANANRIMEAEDQLQRAVDLAAERGALICSPALPSIDLSASLNNKASFQKGCSKMSSSWQPDYPQRCEKLSCQKFCLLY